MLDSADLAMPSPSPWPLAVAGMLLGAIVGSFIANLSARWPAGRSSLGGRSACDGCGATLGPAELVPIISYVIQRGRCRRCGVAIGQRYPAIEGIAALIGAGASFAPWPLAVAGLAFGLALLLLGVLDLEHYWLPDAITLPLAVLGLAAAAAGSGPGLADSLIGGIAGFAALAAIRLGYRTLRGREGMGGGDPKLLGAIGAWLGWQALPLVLLLASTTGLLLALAGHVAGRPVRRDMRLPLGTLLAAAAWPVWLWLAIAGRLDPG